MIDQGIDQGTAILIAAGAGTIGVLFTGRQQRGLLRRQHTSKIIERYTEWPKFERMVDQVAQIIRDDRIPKRDEPYWRGDMEAIDFLLDYYELLSARIWSGDIDETLVRECEGSRLRSIHSKLAGYIAWCREPKGASRTWRNLEQLADRWTRFPEGPDALSRLIEYLIGHPLRRTNY